MIKSANSDAPSASLVRPADEQPGFPGLVRIGEKMARGMKALFATFGTGNPVITAGPLQTIAFGEWRASQAALAGICRFRLKPIKGSTLMVFPPQLIGQLVDGYYGGTGDVRVDRPELTGAEERFLTRLGAMFIELFSASWAEVAPLTPELAATETDLAHVALVKETDLVVIQPLMIKGAPFGSTQIDIIYPAAALRPFTALSEAGERESATPVDSVWQERIAEAVMQVRLPVRTIFARTELPLTRLLTLQVGDLIPICLPNRIPLTVAGRYFAEGTVGDANGRAAIRIEKIEQGLIAYD